MIIITGMHRSGTSLLMHYFIKMGFKPPKRTSRGGLYESSDLFELNEAILKANSMSWDHVSDKTYLSFPSILRSRALCFLRQNPEMTVMKDPRLSITLPLWQNMIDDLDVIICYRNPIEVAKSLFIRNAIPEKQALRLWQLYNDRLKNLNAAFVHFGANVPEYEYFDNVRRMSEFLDIEFKPSILELCYNHKKIHNRFDSEVPTRLKSLYATLNLRSDAT